MILDFKFTLQAKQDRVASDSTYTYISVIEAILTVRTEHTRTSNYAPLISA